MKFIIDMIKGMFVGIANVIPGVSGGTMAVSLGIYDRLLSAISNLLKEFKKSIKTLLPILLGCAIGILLFSKMVEYLLGHFPFATAMAFTGLIIGGIPMIWNRMQEGYQQETKKSVPVYILVFILFLAISIILPLLNGGNDDGSVLTASPVLCTEMFFVGIIASATMVIPGVSGSLVMMIMGFYFGIIGSINTFVDALLDFNMEKLLNEFLILFPFGIGCILGIFLISKLIEWLFRRFPTATFSAIMGLILSSPFAIFYKVQQESSMANTKLPEIIISVLILIACTIVTYKLGREDDEPVEIPE